MRFLGGFVVGLRGPRFFFRSATEEIISVVSHLALKTDSVRGRFTF